MKRKQSVLCFMGDYDVKVYTVSKFLQLKTAVTGYHWVQNKMGKTNSLCEFFESTVNKFVSL